MDERLSGDLAGMRAAHAELVRRLADLEDAEVGLPSRLPGWTVGHVLAHLPAARWRELEVHHVDLGRGYEPSDWPPAFVERTLPDALAGVGARLPGLDGIDSAVVLAWTFGRADPPSGLPELRPF